jgi:hypothetical protein
LIERFPLMLFTTSAVFLIGLVRWYLAITRPAGRAAAQASQRGGLMGMLSTKVSSAFAGNGSVDERPGQRAARPRHVADRSGSDRRRSQQRNPQRSSTRSRGSRQADDYAPPRSRRDSGRRSADDWESDIPRRRTHEPRDPRRTPPPTRREPRERREYQDSHPPRPARSSRYEPYETGRGYQSHQAYPPEPRRRPSSTGSNSTHHPISRVRYRDSDPSDADYRDDSRNQPRR